MKPIVRWRRFAIAAIALTAACLLFRSQIAQALVVRGDDFMYRGQPLQALSHYARAVSLDADLGIAVDRYVFVSMQRHDPASLRSGIYTADAYLARNPRDATVMADRAMCYLAERHFRAARRDFELAARASSEARDYVFAGWAALRSGDSSGARALWRQALRIESRYEPALVALSEHPR
jgi:tetratricopeptide (TPR) repeat protein